MKTKYYEKIKIKLNKLFMCLGIITFMLLFPVTDAYAYDEASSYVDEEGNWEVDNADGPTVSVSMYMMVQPDYTGTSGFRNSYWFWCNEGEFNYLDGRHDTSAGMNFFFRAENADVVEVWEGNEIWFWHFNIEPGTYQFSEPEGINNVTVLTQSFGSTLRADGYNEAEKTVVEDGDEIRLYCMFGEWEWRRADGQMEALQAYAQKREEELSYGRPKETEEGEVTTIAVEGVEEISEEVVDKELAVEQTISKQRDSEDESVEQVINEASDENSKNDDTTTKEEKTSIKNVGKVIFILGIIVLLSGVCTFFFKKNKKNTKQ